MARSGDRSYGTLQFRFLNYYDYSAFVNRTPYHPAQPFDVDKLGPITLRMQDESMEVFIEKLHIPSQSMAHVGELLNKWRRPPQVARKRKKKS